MLLLGIVTAPSVGLQALQRPHCVQHGAAAMKVGLVASRRAPPDSDFPTWTKAASHECPHCPPSECARIAPCTSSSTTALSPTAVGVTDLPGSRVPVRLVRNQASSVHSPPDTPPPQLIT
jgi:hypothetical protein